MLIENVPARMPVHILVNMWSISQVSEALSATEALFSGPKLPKDLNVTNKEVCIYYNAEHWSDECSK